MITAIKIILITLFLVLIGGYELVAWKLNSNNDDELLAVVVVFRHGDKFPKTEYYEVYPNSPNKDPKLWVGDYGGLTNKGKTRLLELGKWLRERYNNFLPMKYSNKDIYVRASDTDRVLMSAQTLLAGLYPPEGQDVWHDMLKWQPIPVHTLPSDEDMILAQKATCPMYNELLKKELMLNRRGAVDDMKHLKEHTGREIKSLQDAYRLYSILKIEDENGFTLPPWARKALPLLKQKTDLLTQSYAMTRQMQKLKAGPFFHTLITHFNNIIEGKADSKKFVLYGGHARTLANILTAMGTFTERPPYGASVIFELKRSNNNIFIERFYKPSTDKPVQLTKRQTFTRFKEDMAPIVIDVASWRHICNAGIDISNPMRYALKSYF